MKPVLMIIIAFMLLISMEAISQRSMIHADVEGNIVTLWEEQANRNCGALYYMEIDRNQGHLVWYQVDTGDAAFCFCNFDLSVTYGPLEPGEYLVDVYYTESFTVDTLFSGSTTFTVINKNEAYRSGVISQYQSECYPIGIADNKWMDEDDILVYPNPARRDEDIYISIVPLIGDGILEAITLDGESVLTEKIRGNRPVRHLKFNENHSLVNGIYLIRLTSGKFTWIKKLVIN